MPNPSRRVFVIGRGLFLAASAFLFVAMPPLVAQQPQAPADQAPSQPVFRGGVEFVSVDVFPRRDGQVVEGLTAADFQILEDGARQTIERFEFIRIETNLVDTDRRDPTSQADGDAQAADARNRVFVVYLDLAHTTIGGGHQARQPVVEFLNRTIGARDLFGVMTAETPASQLVFGRRLDTIEGELERYWTWGQLDRVAIMPRSSYEERLSNCATYAGQVGAAGAEADAAMIAAYIKRLEQMLVALHREDQLVTSLENLMNRLGSLRDERKNVLFISEGWVPERPREELRALTISDGALPLIGVGPGGRLGLGQTMPQDTGDLAWCDAEFARLGGTDFEARFRLLLRSAQEANVSFYPVDVGGLRTSSRLGGVVDTLRTLAENTDGFAVVGTNDLVGAVRRIEQDLSAYYLLGYYSTNPVANGSFRRIDVKVDTPGVRISARRGYFAMTPEMAAAAAAPRAATVASAVSAAVGRLATIRPDAAMFLSGVATPEGLNVRLELAAEAIREEGWSDGTSVEIVVLGSGGAATSQTVTLAAGERSAQVAILRADAGPGPWRVTARARGRDRAVEESLAIEPSAARLVGEPVAFRAMPSPRSPLRPLADARVSRLERLRVEWPLVGDGASHVVRLLDRTGKELGSSFKPTPAPEGRRAVFIDLPLAPLSEGDYVLELVAIQGEVSERRLLAFRVTR
jgi:VWFA-related protein